MGKRKIVYNGMTLGLDLFKRFPKTPKKEKVKPLLNGYQPNDTLEEDEDILPPEGGTGLIKPKENTMVNKKNEFTEMLFGQSMLDCVIEWIQENLDPDHVFTEEQLMEWYESHHGIEKE